MSLRPAVPWVLALAVLAVVVVRVLGLLDERPPDGAGAPPSADTTYAAEVTRVVDGDTIRVRIGDRRERVRYIGIDAPESRRPGTPVQCFAREAGARNVELVGGEAVSLRTDAEPHDRFGRLLAYVHRRRDGLFVNEALLREGFATTLAIAPNLSHSLRFRELERAARRQARGLWRACLKNG